MRAISPTVAGGRTRTAWRSVGSALRGIRWWFASVMGDNAYARYVDHLTHAHPDAPVPTESEYWRARYAAADAEPGARCC